MRIRKLLIISYFANVDSLAPSHHIDDRLRILKEKGIEVRLLSSPCGARSGEFPHVRTPSLAPSGIRYEIRHIVKRKTNTRFWYTFWQTLLLIPVYPFYIIEKILIRLDSAWSWFLTASIAAAVLSIKEKPDIIYSTGGPISAHITGMITSSITGVPYIAEVQDPLVYRYTPPMKKFCMEKTETMLFKKAKAVVFLTDAAARRAASRNASGAKAVTIYSGAVPGVTEARYEKSETFSISHFGSLAGSRDLRHFFAALSSLFDARPELLRQVALHLYGSNGRNVKKQIERFRYHQALRLHGKVKRQDSLDRMCKTDVLLLIQNSDEASAESIPSKMYEYLHSGRPIIALVYRNVELRTMLERLGHIVVEADDETGILGALEGCIRQWQDGSLAGFAESPFTVEKAVDELVNLAGSVCGGKA